MNPALVFALAGLAAAPAAPVPKAPAPNAHRLADMGVRVQNVVDGDNAPLQISAPEPGTPAYKAGLQIGDLLVKVGRVAPRNFEDVQDYVLSLRPGSEVAVEVRRGTETRRLWLTLEERPTTPDYPPANLRKPKLGEN